MFQPHENISSQERDTFCVFQEVEYELHTLQQELSFSSEFQEDGYPAEIEKLSKVYPWQEERIQWYWDMLNSTQAVFPDDDLFIKVALVFAKQCPINLLDYYDSYKDKIYAKKLLKEIKQSLAHSDSESIMNLCKDHWSLLITIGEKDLIKWLLKKVLKASRGWKDLLSWFWNYWEILIEAGELEFIKGLLQDIIQKEKFWSSHLIILFEDYWPLLLAFWERVFIKDLLSDCLKQDLQADMLIDWFQSYGPALIGEWYRYIVKQLLKDFLEKQTWISPLIKWFEHYWKSLLELGEQEFVITLLYALWDGQAWFFINNFDYEKNKKILWADIIDPLMDRLTLKLFEWAFSEPISQELLVSVKKNITSLTLPKGKILQLKASHINMYSWLLKTYLAHKEEYDHDNNSIDRVKVKLDYEKNITTFIEQGKERSEKTKENIHVFMVRPSNGAGDDKNSSFSSSNQKIKEVYQDKFAWSDRFHDYSSDINPQSPNKILDAFEKNIEEYPNDKHLFHIWGHSSADWSLYLKGWKREKKHFARLLNIKAQNPHLIKIDIWSCYSWYKDENFYDNTIKNLSLDSVRHFSFGWKNWSDDTFLAAFTLKNDDGTFIADYDGDGVVSYNEALLYRNITNNSSLAMMTVDDGQGNPIDISMLY